MSALTLMFPRYLGTGVSSLVSSSSRCGGSSSSGGVLLKKACRGLFSVFMGAFAFDMRKNALNVDTEKPHAIYDFYMYVWNIFYACYLILPLVGMGTTG